jgi:outer membrane protein assembly factor BamB
LQAEKSREATATIGVKGRVAMHNIEHKPAQEEPASTSKEKGATMTERQKLPRAWRYAIIGGSVLLVFAVIIAGLLTFVNQKAKPSPRIVPTHTNGASTIPTTIARETTLPAPVATPIPAPAFSDQTVNITIAGGVAYLSTSDYYASTSNNAVYALRTGNGALLWHQKIEGSADQAPLVANGVVYVTSYVGQNGPAYAYAFRASDGSLLWRYRNTNYSYLSPSTSDSNVVYVASQDGISALNTSNGVSLWHFAAQDTGSTWPLEVNGTVYFSSSSDNGSGTLYALRASDGHPIWQYKTGSYTNTPLVANGVVYINSDGGSLAALRASDGHQLWKRIIDANLIQSPQLVNGVLYTTTTKISEPPAAYSASPLQATTAIGSLLWNTFQNVPAAQTIPQKQGLSSVYAIRASDGSILWHYTMNHGGNSWASWLSVENGVVYASAITDTSGTTSLGDIYALQSSNGSVLWHDKLNMSPGNALLANGIIYLSTSNGSSNGTVYAVRASDGTLFWDYPISGSMFNTPILDSNSIYVSANNGMAYALRADNGRIVWHYFIQVGG